MNKKTFKSFKKSMLEEDAFFSIKSNRERLITLKQALLYMKEKNSFYIDETSYIIGDIKEKYPKFETAYYDYYNQLIIKFKGKAPIITYLTPTGNYRFFASIDGSNVPAVEIEEYNTFLLAFEFYLKSIYEIGQKIYGSVSEFDNKSISGNFTLTGNLVTFPVDDKVSCFEYEEPSFSLLTGDKKQNPISFYDRVLINKR